MQIINHKNELFALLKQGAMVITPNNRLSASVIVSYYQSIDESTIDKPQCYPYSTALTLAYTSYIEQNKDAVNKILLNKVQYQHLWRHILKQDQSITYSEGLLKTVMSDWQHCQQWGLTATQTDFHYTHQTKAFTHWWQQFEKQLDKLNAITEFQIVKQLLPNHSGFFAKPLIWMCFDELTPEQEHLIRHLSAQNIPQYSYDLVDTATQPETYAAADEPDELKQILHFIQQGLRQNEHRIGVVIPDIEQKKHLLNRYFLKHFDSELLNSSLGQSLNDYPMIAHAFTWLYLNPKNISNAQASLLLQSPYLSGAQSEFVARSHYLQESKLLNQQSINGFHFARDLSQTAPILSSLLEQLAPYPHEAPIKEWVTYFQQRLEAFGFPGDAGLTSHEYQYFNRLSHLFDEFKQLALISPKMNTQEALSALTKLVQNTIFQPEQGDAKIHISGLLEASGCSFDRLWVMGLTDLCLPQKIKLSAFIPHHLQRKLSMPHSTPEREYHFAKITLDRLRRGSDQIVFSYPQMTEDTHNLPSSLIRAYPEYKPEQFQDKTSKTDDRIHYSHDYQIPLLPNEPISGGTSLLANQAKCPFKAFADHRLKAKPPVKLIDGQDQLERGQIIHKVMELFWREVESQAALLSLSDQAIDSHIHNAIAMALKSRDEDNQDNPLAEIETIRLKRIVWAAIEWEKQRPEFSIAHLEHAFSMEIAGLPIKVRVDRMDSVGDRKWVIDYKSSLSQAKPWNEERPKEVQLLLYALLDDAIDTILLLQLKTGSIQSSGISEEKSDIPGITSLKKGVTWQETRTKWHEQLTLLAQEFQQGHCPPQPDNLAICQYCDFKNLCRFRPYL